MMKKIFTMAALALLMTACSNDIDELQAQQQPANPDGMITITAKLAPKSEAATRAVETGKDSENKDIIKVKWAVDEHLAILYEVNSTKYEADAKISYVDANTGIATIEFSVQAGTADDTPCTIVYPLAAAKDDYSGVKDAATLLATQDGTLNANLDVRVGAGTIIATTPNLIVTTQPAAQFAIHKFTIQDLSAADKTATEFKVSDASGNVITTVTPGSATGTLYVALPVMAVGTYWFNATVGGAPYIAKATVNTATTAGKFYQTQVNMATIGDYLNKDGSFTATKQTSGDNESYAVIAYVGSVDKYFGRFLALALTDVDANYHTWAQALTAVGTYAAAHPVTIGSTTYETSTTGATYYDQVASNQSVSSATATAIQTGWRLPSVTDWRYVFDGLGRIKGGLNLSDGTNAVTPTSPLGVSNNMVYRNGNDGSTLRNAINTACGNEALPSLNYCYWSSSECTDDSNNAWYYNFYNGIFWWCNKTSDLYVHAVFAY